MYYVFLDTNLFVANFQFNSKYNSKLLKYSKRGDITLCITYTNYLEVIKKFKDTISSYVNNMKTANAEFHKHSGKFLIDNIKKPKEYTEEYKNFFDKLIADNNINVIKHTSDFSGKIIEKYFKNEKPFDINKPSFQDAIIWETIYDFYIDKFNEEEDRIFFLTGNIKDFAKEISNDEGTKYILHENLLEETPELKVYKNAEEFFKNEEDDLHDYLIDNFTLDEDEAIKAIRKYLSETREIELEIERFLSYQEFDSEYFSGWGEDAYEILDDIIFEDVSKDIETGVVELNCSLEYEVKFTIATKNPVYEADDPDDFEFLRDESGEARIQISTFIKMLNNEIINFSIDEIQFI